MSKVDPNVTIEGYLNTLSHLDRPSKFKSVRKLQSYTTSGLSVKGAFHPRDREYKQFSAAHGPTVE